MIKLNELKKGTQKLIDKLQWEASVYIPDFTKEELNEIESDFAKFNFSDLYIDGDYYLYGLLAEIEETKEWFDEMEQEREYWEEIDKEEEKQSKKAEAINKILTDYPDYKDYLNNEKDFCIELETITTEEKEIALELLRYGLVLKYCCIDGDEWLFVTTEE